MEGLIGILVLGFCVWTLFRHPLKSLSFIFKVGLLLVLGFGVSFVGFYLMAGASIQT